MFFRQDLEPDEEKVYENTQLDVDVLEVRDRLSQFAETAMKLVKE